MKARGDRPPSGGLRDRARQILRDHDFDGTLEEYRQGGFGLDDLLEELHVFHAELQLQQEALQDSHQLNELALARFARLYYDLPLPALRVSWDGLLKDSNAAACALLALDCKLLCHLAEPSHMPVLELALLRARATGRAECPEVALRGGRDKTLLADLVLILLPGTDEGAPEFICTIVDQTERIAQRNALKSTAEVVDASSTVAFRWHLSTGWPVSYASENVRRWSYGIESFQSGQMRFLDLVHPDDRADLQQTLAKAQAAGQESFTLTYRVRWADGSVRWVEAHNHLAPSPIGEGGVQALLTDVTERELAHAELRYQLNFQELVAGVSSLFVNRCCNRLDQVMTEALAQIADFFEAEACLVYRFSTDERRLGLAHEWRAADGAQPSTGQDPTEPQASADQNFPWWVGRLLGHRHLDIPDLEALPPEAAAERDELQRHGTRSRLATPLISNGQILGALALDVFSATRRWSGEEVRLLRLVGESIASMLARIRAEADLMASELRYRQVSAIMSDVAYSCLDGADGRFRIDWITDSIAALTGYSTEEVKQIGCWEFLVLPEDRPRFAHATELGPGQTSTCELRLVHKDGGIRWVRCATQCVVEADRPSSRRLYGGLVDITDQKARDGELQRLAQLVEQSPSIVLVTDVEGGIQYVNERFCEITGYSRQEVHGRHVDMLQAEATTPSATRDVWRHLSSGQTWRGEFQNRKKSGETYWEQALIAPLRDAEGTISHFVKLGEDVSDKKALTEQLTYLIHYDPLTGLPNRALLRERIDRALASARRRAHGLALLSIDLDRLKLINDSLGHLAGDRLLKEIAQRLQTLLGEEDTLARIGGDNFVLLVARLEHLQDSVGLAERLNCTLDEPVLVGGGTTRVTACTGISLFPEDARTTDELIGHADAALHEAKTEGRRLYRFYTPALNKQLLEQFHLEQALRHGLERNELLLYFQPRVDIQTGKILSLEALARWRHPDQGLVAPSRFIPVAESTGLILELGPIVLRQACEQIRRWQARGVPIVPVAVNLSANELYQDDLAQRIRSIMTATQVEPGQLELEITESATMRSIDQAIAILSQLRSSGFSLSIDDFGTGYASLSYLNRLPIQSIKIDRSFLSAIGPNLGGQGQAAAIIKAIIGLGSNLGLHIIAEGVETQDQRAFLLAHGCQVAQGFLFTSPLPADEIEPLLRAGRVPIPD